MVLDDIEVFTEVVAAKSFSRAAKRLGMPVSTVSAKIARLEERLGRSLIRRTTRQMNVTAEGQTYYKYCVRALAELSKADDILAQSTGEPTGVLRLTAPADLAHFVLAPVVESYLSKYPNASVELIVTNQKVDLVGEGIDLAVRIADLEDSNLIARKYINTRIGLWASEQYRRRNGLPQSVAELADHECIDITMAKHTAMLLGKDGLPISAEFSGRLVTDDMQTCRRLIEIGAGIGPLPDFMAAETSGGHRLVRVLPELASASATAYFVYPEQRFVSQNVRAFMDCALDML